MSSADHMDQRIAAVRDRAAILAEALPFLRRYVGRTLVIKYGGHAMGDDAVQASFAGDIALLKQVGIHPVVIHGGGPQIGAMLERLDIRSEFIDGLRVTGKATVEVVEMVLSGAINKSLASAITRAGAMAVGLSGKDGNLIGAQKLERRVADPDSNIERVLDLGFVGEPASVNPHLLEMLRDNGAIPVIAPIGVGNAGETYNINADSVAGAVAGALGATRLIMLTDISGVRGVDGEMISELSPEAARAAIRDGIITGGMIPKVETCLKAVAGGAGGAVICEGRTRHAVLLELLTERGFGTIIRTPQPGGGGDA